VGLCAVSCAREAELIEMQFGMLSQMGPGNMYYMGCRRCLHGKRHCWGLWLIDKHCKVIGFASWVKA